MAGRRYYRARKGAVGRRIHTVVRAMHRVTAGGIVGPRRAREVLNLRRRKLILLIPIFALVLPACGTRLPNSAFVNAQRGRSGQQAAAGDQGATTDEGGATTGGDQGSAG